MLRIQNLYGNPQAMQQDDPYQILNDSSVDSAGLDDVANQSSLSIQQQQIPNQQQPDIQNRLRQLYQPQSAASDRFNQLLQQMPQREQPGKLRQIAALMAGLGTGGPAEYYNGMALGFKSNPSESLKVQSAIRDEPYNQKMQDWTTRLKPAEYAANLERETNAGNERAANQQYQREQEAQRLAENERKDKAAEADKIRLRELEQKRWDDEHNDRAAKLQQTAADAQKKAEMLQQKYEADQGNKEALLKLKEAELSSLNARHALELEQKKKQLDDTIRLHDAQVKNMEEQRRQSDEKLKLQGQAKGAMGSTTETTTSEPPGFLGKLFGAGPTIKKQVETVKTPFSPNGQPANNQQQPKLETKTDPKRQQAIKILTDAKKQVVEENIKHVMDQLGK